MAKFRLHLALPLLFIALTGIACAQSSLPVEYVQVLSKSPLTQSVLVPREVCYNEPAGGYYRNSFNSARDGDVDLSPRPMDLLKTDFGDRIRELSRRANEERAKDPQRPPETRPNPPPSQPTPPVAGDRGGRDRGRDQDRGRDRDWDRDRFNPPRTVFVPVPSHGQPRYVAPGYVAPRYVAPPTIYVAPAPFYSTPPAYYAPQPTYVRKCHTQNEYVTQTVGFEIVYEYLGQRYKGQVNTDPGNYVALKQGYFQGDASPTVYPEGATQKPTLLF